METKIFHIILYVIFGAFIIVGFGSIGIYGYLKKEENSDPPAGADVTVELWGTVSAAEMEPVVTELNRRREKQYNRIVYTRKNPSAVRDAYIESIAVGEQPDLLLLDHTTVLGIEETLQTVPFSYFPLAQYQRFFVPAADIFIRQDGYLALPFLMDTMVLYYNENLRLRENITVLPTVWSSFTLGGYQRISAEYRESGRALIPLGGYANYANAPELFSAMLLQVRESPAGLTHDTVHDAVTLYRSFADPRLSVYTWNTALPDARAMFAGNNLLFYPGFISEYRTLRQKNPNVVVRVAPLPQMFRDSVAVTPARLYAFTIPNSSRAPSVALQAAFDFIGVLGGADNSASELFTLPPAVQGYVPDSTTPLTEKIFIDSIFSGRVLNLTHEERRNVIEILREAVVGTRSVAESVPVLIGMFR